MYRLVQALIVAWLTPLVGSSIAQPIQVDVDEAIFAYDAQHSMAEIYLAFDAAALSFEDAGDAYVARLPIEMRVLRESDAQLEGTPTAAVWSDSSTVLFTVPDTSVIESGQYFIHQFRALVPPGEYELSIVIPEDEAEGRPELEIRRDLTPPTRCSRSPGRAPHRPSRTA